MPGRFRLTFEVWGNSESSLLHVSMCFAAFRNVWVTPCTSCTQFRSFNICRALNFSEGESTPSKVACIARADRLLKPNTYSSQELSSIALTKQIQLGIELRTVCPDVPRRRRQRFTNHFCCLTLCRCSISRMTASVLCSMPSLKPHHHCRPPSHHQPCTQTNIHIPELHLPLNSNHNHTTAFLPQPHPPSTQTPNHIVWLHLSLNIPTAAVPPPAHSTQTQPCKNNIQKRLPNLHGEVNQPQACLVHTGKATRPSPITTRTVTRSAETHHRVPTSKVKIAIKPLASASAAACKTANSGRAMLPSQDRTLRKTASSIQFLPAASQLPQRSIPAQR